MTSPLPISVDNVPSLPLICSPPKSVVGTLWSAITDLAPEFFISKASFMRQKWNLPTSTQDTVFIPLVNVGGCCKTSYDYMFMLTVEGQLFLVPGLDVLNIKVQNKAKEYIPVSMQSGMSGVRLIQVFDTMWMIEKTVVCVNGIAHFIRPMQ